MSPAALVVLAVCLFAPCALALWLEQRLGATQDALAVVTTERDALRDELARPVPMSPDDARLEAFRIACAHSLGPIATTCPGREWAPLMLRRSAQTLPVPMVFLTRWAAA